MVSKIPHFSYRFFWLRNNVGKRGFGGVISSLIMFIAIIIVTTSFIMLFNERVDKTEVSLRMKNDLLLNKLRTEVSIVDVLYNGTSNEVKFYLKNIGKTKIYGKRLDVFIDGEYVKNFSVLDPSDFSSLVLIEPYDLALVNFSKGLNHGTHKLLIHTEYGTSDDFLFNT